MSSYSGPVGPVVASPWHTPARVVRGALLLNSGAAFWLGLVSGIVALSQWDADFGYIAGMAAASAVLCFALFVLSVPAVWDRSR